MMELSYTILGRGKKVLLAFHGITQTGADCYGVFEKYLGEIYTIYAFDLPFHGQRSEHFLDQRWLNGNHPITQAEFESFLLKFLEQQKIDRFSVAGFSIGGRFALTTLECFAPRIDYGYLIAPDGIKSHLIFRIATHNRVMRRLFKWAMTHTTLLYKSAEFLQKRGILHPSVLKMLKHMIATPERARTVYFSWVNFRKLGLTSGKNFQDELPRVYVLVGQFDHLIRQKDLVRLIKYLPPNQVIALAAGHVSSVNQAAIEIQKIEHKGLRG